MPSLSGSNNVNITVTTEADTKGIDETRKKLDELNQTTKNAEEPTGTLGQKFSGLADGVRSVGAYIAGYQLLSFFQNFSQLAFGGAGELEQTSISMQNLIGNTKEANEVFGQLTQYANVTPFQSKDVEGSAKQLLAFGFAGKDVVGVVKQLGDVTAAGGGDLQALSLVTGQVFAQGKMRAQDMYQVINDGGAGLIKIMADNAGGMQNLTKEFENGGIPASQYFAAIQQATANGGFAFEGADKQAQTFNGKISTLKDSVQQFAMKLLGVHIDPKLGLVMDKGGLFERAKGFIDKLTAGLTELAKHKVAIDMIAGALGGVLLGVIIALVVAVGWIPIAIVAAAAVIGAIVAFIIDKWKEWHNWIILIGVVLFGMLAIAVIVVVEIIKHWTDIVNFFKQAWSDIKQWASDAWQGIQAVWGGVTGFFSNIWTTIKNDAKRVIDDIVNFFKDMPDRIMKAVGNISTKIAGDFKAAAHSLHIPGFASGVHNFGGGLAVVGEQGPELVNLPAGSDVYSNGQSQSMLGGSVSTNFYGNITLGDAGAVQAFFAKLDQDVLLSKRGLTPNRGLR